MLVVRGSVSYLDEAAFDFLQRDTKEFKVDFSECKIMEMNTDLIFNSKHFHSIKEMRQELFKNIYTIPQFKQ